MATKLIREQISKKKKEVTYVYELHTRTYEGIRSELLGCDESTRKWNGEAFVAMVPLRAEIIEFSNLNGFKIECNANRQTLENLTNGTVTSTNSTLYEKHLIGPLSEVEAVSFSMMFSQHIAKHEQRAS